MGLRRKPEEVEKALFQVNGANGLIAIGIFWTVSHVLGHQDSGGTARALVKTQIYGHELVEANFFPFNHEDLAADPYVLTRIGAEYSGALIGSVPIVGDTLEVIGFHRGKKFSATNKVIAVGRTPNMSTNNFFIAETTSPNFLYQVGMSCAAAVNDDGEVVGLLSRQFTQDSFKNAFGVTVPLSKSDKEQVVFFALEPYT